MTSTFGGNNNFAKYKSDKFKGEYKKKYKKEYKKDYDINMKDEIKKLKAQVNSLKKEVDEDIEKKFQEVNVVAGTVGTNAAQVYSLNGLTKGANNNQRIGNDVTALKISVRGFCRVNAAAGVNMIRLIIFKDRQNNGGLPTWNQIVDIATITDYYLAYRNENYFERFEILHEQMFVLSLVTNNLEYFSINVKLNFKVNHGLGNSGDQTDITSGLICLALISDTPSNMPSMAWCSRYKYVDC